MDGEWRTRDDRPTETGADYITNNILRTKPKPVGSATNGPSDIGLESSAEPTSQQVDDTQPLKVLAEETPAALSNPVQDVVDATYALAPENAGTPTHTREGGDVVATPTMINSEGTSFINASRHLKIYQCQQFPTVDVPPIPPRKVQIHLSLFPCPFRHALIF